MHIDEIPDTPSKYKSKREYILTPPEIILPDYEKIKTEATRPQNNLASKVNLNSDIFVSDTDEFYKDAKVIEGKEVKFDNDKIQETFI